MASGVGNFQRTPGPRRLSGTRVLLACAGLDHTRRGFETFARECFEALRDEPELSLELAKGSGARAPGERPIRTLRRDHPLARAVAGLLDTPPARLEALAFAFSLLPVIARSKPNLVYLSEWDTARALAAVRSISRQRFKVLLCNGTLALHGYEHFDHVQDLNPAVHEHVLERGAEPTRHTMLPLGFRIPADHSPTSAARRSALRAELGLPGDRMIVLSVAALNQTAKRLDYLIRDLAVLPTPRPFLTLVGEPDNETPTVRSLANQCLGSDGFDMRTVPASLVGDMYRASDVFVLPSLVEGQSRSVIEAMSHGLACIAHDSPVMHFALGEHGIFANLARPGSLAGLLRALMASDRQLIVGQAAARHRHVYERFSWERLRPRYVELLKRVASCGADAFQAERKDRARR